jgi:hypothetical protein
MTDIALHKVSNRHKSKLFTVVRELKDNSLFPMESFLTEDEAKEFARLQMRYIPNKEWIYFIMEVPVSNLVLKKWGRRKSVVGGSI